MIDKNKKKPHYSTESKIIKRPSLKTDCYLYLSIDKWFHTDKIYYKIDYVMLGGEKNYLPNKKISSEQKIIYQARYELPNHILHLCYMTKIRPFEFTSSLDYKIVSNIIETGFDEKINLLEKFFSCKKLLVQNTDTLQPEKIILEKKQIDKIDIFLSDLVEKLTINDSDNNDNQ